MSPTIFQSLKVEASIGLVRPVAFNLFAGEELQRNIPVTRETPVQ